MKFDKQNYTNLFRMRPSLLFKSTCIFSMPDRTPEDGDIDHVLTSLPLYSKYLGLNSVRDIDYERIVIKMKSD